jgi:hypothetical protein
MPRKQVASQSWEVLGTEFCTTEKVSVEADLTGAGVLSNCVPKGWIFT